MSVTHTFAGIAVADLAAARDWYERLFGREPDMVPNDREVCWEATDGAWVYVVRDDERVGGSLLTLLVDDLDAMVAELARRGLEPSGQETIPDTFRKAEFTDPEGNRVTFAQPL